MIKAHAAKVDVGLGKDLRILERGLHPAVG
jgi:hypothetical protein